ncbi:leucine-rich repeat flightless-interacting protein 2-like [Tachysurus ichikawai]
MFGSVNPRAADLPTRPLLCAAGIAVGVYCYFKCKRRFRRKKAVTDGQFRTSVFPSTEAPSICCRAPQLEERVRELEGLLRKAQKNEAKSLVSLADAELKHKDALDSISQLEEEKSELKNQVDKLCSTVQELGEELCQCHLEKEELLKLEHVELKQELFLKEVVLKVSLADAELKHKDALDSISQLEEEKSELKDQVDKLHSTVQELGEELCQCHLENEELLKECEQNKEAHKALQLEHVELKQELFLKEVVLKVSLADAELKHKDALDSISQLEEEKSELKDQVDKLHSTVQELGEELCQCHLENEELLKVSK